MAKLFLAIVLGVAAIGRITDWPSFEKAVTNLGLTGIFVRPVAGFVAIAESLTFGPLVFSRATDESTT